MRLRPCRILPPFTRSLRDLAPPSSTSAVPKSPRASPSANTAPAIFIPHLPRQAATLTHTNGSTAAGWGEHIVQLKVTTNDSSREFCTCGTKLRTLAKRCTNTGYHETSLAKSRRQHPRQFFLFAYLFPERYSLAAARSASLSFARSPAHTASSRA